MKPEYNIKIQKELNELQYKFNNKNIERLCNLTMGLAEYVEYLELRIRQLEDKCPNIK